MKLWKKINYDCMLNVIYVLLVYMFFLEYNKNIFNIDVIY